MSAPITGQIKGIGIPFAVAIDLDQQDTNLLVVLSGGDFGVALVVEGKPRGGTIWAPLLAPVQAALGQAQGERYDVSEFSAVRVWTTLLTSGPISVYLAASPWYR